MSDTNVNVDTGSSSNRVSIRGEDIEITVAADNVDVFERLLVEVFRDDTLALDLLREVLGSETDSGLRVVDVIDAALDVGGSKN